MTWFQRIFSRDRMRGDLSAEMRQHLDEKIESFIAAGMSREDATHAARRAFGNSTLIEERSREVWMWPLLESLWSDIRFSLRQLRKSPGFAFTAILVLALGIGANTAMFTVVDAVLLRTLPYAHPGQLAIVNESDNKKAPTFGVIYPDVVEWMKTAKTIEEIALWSGGDKYFQGPALTQKVNTIPASANIFSLLGVSPEAGRTFTQAEQAPGRDNVVVLSDALWAKHFHRDPNVLGKTVKLDDQLYFVIGVMPAGFSFPFSETNKQVWTPLTLTPSVITRGNEIGNYNAIARLRPGASLTAVQTELNGLQSNTAKEYPASYPFPKPVGVELRSYRSVLFSSFRPALLILQLACGILWLIACANVAGLMLVRGTVRQRELAVRQALGASRKRIVWQSLLDSLILSVSGATVGFGLAALALWGFHTALMHRIDALQSIHLNLPVLAALAGFSILTALVFGLVPAWLASRGSVTQVLQQGGQQTTAGSHPKRLRDALIVTEIALSLTLLVACGLLLRTLYALRQMPLGIRTEHVITADLTIPGYRYQDRNVVTTLYQPLLEKAHHLPDVMAASLSTTVPLGSGFFIQLTMYGNSGAKSQAGQKTVNAWLGVASPEMQKVFGFRMLRGRFFNTQDTSTSQPVAVVNKAFADEYWPGKNPIGEKLLQLRMKDKKSTTIVVGVMDDLPQHSLASKRGPQALLCMSQLGPDSSLYSIANIQVQLALRTREDSGAVVPEIRTLLAQLAPELRGTKIETMDQVVEDSLGDQKLAAHLLEIFGGTALLITLAGLYGSLLYMVSLRNREMAIRLALGAQREQVMRLVLSQAFALVAIGLGAGIALSYATARFLRGYLFGVHMHDPWTLAAVSLLFAVCAGLAAFIPARRAANVDPIQALRAE